MERTTIYLDSELKRKLREAAARKRISEARMIREALASYLSTEEPVMLEPVGQSEDGGIAEHDEEALEDLGFGKK